MTPFQQQMQRRVEAIRVLADGTRSVNDIAKVLELTRAQVKKTMCRYGIPRIAEGGRPGHWNHQFVAGRRIDHAGYANVTAPADHPYAKQRTNRDQKLMVEHRLVMEQKLGRYLLPGEIVDHIDGLTLHSHPSNLRLFASNKEHLRETLTGRVPRWSVEGYHNMKARHRPGGIDQRVHTYQTRQARGEIRLQQILLAALSLGIDSPYLLGTHRHLEKAEIDASQHSNLVRALDDLYARWGWNQTLSE